MPCEHAEQSLSRSALEDTGVPAPMEVMMAGSPEDICLFACSPQSPGDTWRPQSYLETGAGDRATRTRGSPRAVPSRGREPEPWGHVEAPELPRAESGSPSHGDMWRPRSCPHSRGGSHCLDLNLVHGGTRSLGYRQWPLGPPRERLRTHGWGQHPFPAQPF
jgi:hypothetical protein